MKKTVICLSFVMLLLCCLSCSSDSENGFSYPRNKIWAHRVNTPEEANTKLKKFDGIEVDLVYDTFTGEVFIGHDIDRNMMELTFRQYIQQINNPRKAYFWLDVKNLYDNPSAICDTIMQIANLYGFDDKFFVESWDGGALKIAKNKGIKTSLWVDNLYEKEQDKTKWFEKISRIVNDVQPDALSAEFRMCSILVEYFPEKNIHLWQTPAEFNDENVEITREICRNPHVKVLLVDYDKPISY